MTDEQHRLTIDLWTPAEGWLGRVTDPVSVSGTVRARGADSWQLQVAADDPIADVLTTKGARCAFRYRDAPLSSGAFRGASGTLLPNGNVLAQVQGDGRMLANTLAWIRPGGPIAPTNLVAADDRSWGQAWLPGGASDAGPNGTTQGQYGYTLWPDGSAASGGVLVDYAESAVKWLIAANFARLGRPVVIAADQQRGGNARAAGMLPMLRMAPLDEALASILDWSGLRVVILQEPEGEIIVDVYEPQTWPAPLTVASGVVADGSWSLNPPKATRGVVGGPGEGVDRAFATFADTALEDEYGDVIEVFRDATGANLKWPDTVAEVLRVPKYFSLRPEISAAAKAEFASYLSQSGRKALTEGQPLSGVSAVLTESEAFYFGGTDGVQLGDLVTITAASEEAFTDRITEATFSLTRSEGLTVTPVVGAKTDDPSRKTADTIAALAAAQRRLSASR